MKGLSIRMVPGIGRVHETMLEAIGIKVGFTFCSWTSDLVYWS